MLEIFFLIPAFIIGAAAGSFLNCVIYRLEKNKSFLKGRSFCPHCRHVLSWQDLIPLVSFLMLKAKCRYCSKKISFQYPLTEIITGAVFVLVFSHFSGFFLESVSGFLSIIFYWVISCFLIIIFIFDLKHYIIPDRIVYPAIIIAFLYQLFRALEFANWDLFGIWNLEFGILKPVFSAILAAAFFGAIVFVSQGKWMGAGDIKLAFLMGLILGWPNILAGLFSAFLIGAIMGMALVFSGKKTLKSEVPFGPFLVTGTFIALFWGQKMINFYVQSFYQPLF